ncbi:centrosomal and chromosomal factor isoform X2 [Bombyx mandarina]|uniref:Centrosomal and chromosomal factor isoform X1 n=1 Tax=Bombyx mandarina TaxID=7092 RepID=A0A6J2KU71_BOMMA|nr:centrosomal and chromosomal factor isoform X1 [Bombyx mandarina]XP_028043737.1 centrosomal and chromosomal factor isoform X2 [Bombyx mandarina]
MTGYARGEAEFAAADRFRRDARPASLAPRDYSVPLHVDCSIEYELPDCAKPPQGVKIEPLLMIHPSHFRRLESLRRVPFVNNLPRGDAAAAAAITPANRARAPRAPRRCCRAAPAPAAPPPAPAQAQRQRQPAEEQQARPCYRFESYAPETAGGGKLATRARLKPHPYLPPEALDCDIARALQPPAVPYDRFDKRALQQLPIYM